MDTGIRFVRYALIFVTILVIVFLGVAVSGRGSMSVQAHLDDPFFLELADGRRVGISGNSTTFENFEIGREPEVLGDVGPVGLTINVSRSDTDSRFVIGAIVLGWLAAGWLGLHSLGRVVTETMAGHTFSDESPASLRRLGIAILAVPAIGLIGTFVINRTIETDVPISVAFSGTSTWVLIAVAVGVFALAEIFGEAVRLREFEELTI